MKFLILSGVVHAPATDSDAALGIFDIRDLEGVEVGWRANEDGTYSPPPVVTPTLEALLDYASTRQNAILAGVWAFNVAASGAAAHTVTTRLDDRGQFAMMKVQGWLQLNASNASASLPYSNVDFSSTVLSVAEADSLVEQAAVVDERGYTLLNQVSDAIRAASPTVTTFAQIDAAFAALAPAA